MISHICWSPAYRIIPSCYPSLYLYEDVADSAEFEMLYAIESMTNPRINEDIGDIELVPEADRVFGPGSTCIMAAFTHPRKEGDRFTDGNFGAFYASNALEPAIYETAFHREKFFRESSEPPCQVEMRVYNVDLDAQLVDIRGSEHIDTELYDANNYTHSQEFARGVRAKGDAGIVFKSVRHPLGENVAVFKPNVLSNCREMKYLKYVWDGRKISEVYEVSGARVINYMRDDLK